MTEFVILRDSREKKPLLFYNCDVMKFPLRTGDYSVRGLIDTICVERKSISDLYGSIYRSTFRKELERMSRIKHSYLVIEGSMKRTWRFANTQQYRGKLNPISLFVELSKLSMQYNVHVIFADDPSHAADYVKRLLRTAWKAYSFNGKRELKDQAVDRESRGEMEKENE